MCLIRQCLEIKKKPNLNISDKLPKIFFLCVAILTYTNSIHPSNHPSYRPTIIQSNHPTIQWSNRSTIHRPNHPTIQPSNFSPTQSLVTNLYHMHPIIQLLSHLSNYPTLITCIQLSNDPTIQRSNYPTSKKLRALSKK